MSILNFVFTGTVALLHIYFWILESWYWTKPLGLRVFRQSLEQAQSSKALALNQGYYNSFLAVGLATSLTPVPGADFWRLFLLSCVVAAGLVGGLTVNRRIFWIQSGPAILAILTQVL